MVSAEKSRSKLNTYVLAPVSLFYKFSWRVFEFFHWQCGIALIEQTEDVIKDSLKSFLVTITWLYIINYVNNIFPVPGKLGVALPFF